MDTTRRNFLKSGLLTGTLGLNLNASTKLSKEDPTCGPASGGKRFKFGNEPQRVRKSFYDLTDDEVKNLCRAVGYMRKNIQLNSPIQWENYAKLHAYHCTDSGVPMVQVHWSWHFLPWHRGYIYFLERILANILKTQFKVDDFAYPYWDWINHKEVPNTKSRKLAGLSSPLFGYDLTQEDMVNADNLDFDNLALYDGNRKPSISAPTMDVNNEVSSESKQHIQETIWYMSKEYISAILQAPFEMFGGKSVTDKVTGQGLLEQGPHNNGHDWVGTRYGNNRNMGTLRYAANDPIFFMHHANIDRIFSLYKGEMPDINGPWGKQEYTYVDIDGSPITVTVKDIMNFTNVSYKQPEEESHKLSVTGNKFTTTKSFEVEVNKTISGNESSGLDVVLDYNEVFDTESKLSVIELVTGNINYKGKFRIKVYGGVQGDEILKNLGSASILDGVIGNSNKNDSHIFYIPISNANILKTALNGQKKKIVLSIFTNVKVKDFTLNIKKIKYTTLQ